MRDDWEQHDVGVIHSVPWWVRPGPVPDAPLVVLCHGMGFDPERNVKRWPRVCALPVHLIAPAGPFAHEVRRGETIRIGYAWYLYNGGEEPFRSTVTQTVRWLGQGVDRALADRSLVPRERALVGFSQGAYLGSVAALQLGYERLVMVAGRLREDFVSRELRAGPQTRTLILHGREDTAVPADAAQTTEAALRRAGAPVERVEVSGGHTLTAETDARTADWLTTGWGLPAPQGP